MPSPTIRRSVALAGLAVLLANAAPTFAQAPSDTTTLILLGTGMPVPDPHAQGPATAITIGDRIFLFDAGAGVMRAFHTSDRNPPEFAI